MKKSESKSESEEMNMLRQGLKMAHSMIDDCEEAITNLVGRVKALEGEVEAMQRGDNTGLKHQNDGGYFD